jgi:hypothetical protein
MNEGALPRENIHPFVTWSHFLGQVSQGRKIIQAKFLVEKENWGHVFPKSLVTLPTNDIKQSCNALEFLEGCTMYECAFKFSSLIPIFNPLVNFNFHIFNHCVIFHPFGKKFLIFSSTMEPSKISKALQVP